MFFERLTLKFAKYCAALNLSSLLAPIPFHYNIALKHIIHNVTNISPDRLHLQDPI